GPDYRQYRTRQTWSPSINLYESPTCFCLVADLAGVEVESIELHVEKSYLLLTGERSTPRPPNPEECDPAKPEPQKLHLMEIDHGPFHREIQLPEGVDVEAIEALYRNGYLWIRIPKTT
ncbi:MAG: Hsp20/alpha crystallin family protein, partial [Phycisphaerae bacterium]